MAGMNLLRKRKHYPNDTKWGRLIPPKSSNFPKLKIVFTQSQMGSEPKVKLQDSTVDEGDPNPNLPVKTNFC